MMSDSKKAFEEHVSQFDTMGNKWQDMSIDKHFAAGFEAGKIAANAKSIELPVAEVIPNVVGVEMAWVDPSNKPPVGTKLYARPLRPVVPKGWRIVPIVSTTVMDLAAIASKTDIPDEIWRLMVFFAPKPPKQEPTQ
jgi:hypothetical protein